MSPETGPIVDGPIVDGPLVDQAGVTFRFRDPDHALVAVDLVQEGARSRIGPAFESVADGWEVRFDRPEVDRFEYMIELTHADGGSELILDPANPRAAPGPFGWKSVIDFPNYRNPPWLAALAGDLPKGTETDYEIDSRLLGMRQRVVLWTSDGAAPTDTLPLLVVHDGVEFAEYSSLLGMLRALTHDGMLPPMRAALLYPAAREDHYAASPTYADA